MRDQCEEAQIVIHRIINAARSDTRFSYFYITVIQPDHLQHIINRHIGNAWTLIVHLILTGKLSMKM